MKSCRLSKGKSFLLKIALGVKGVISENKIFENSYFQATTIKILSTHFCRRFYLS